MPLFKSSSDISFIMKIDITSPANTVLQLFYTTGSEPAYTEKQSIRTDLIYGHNEVFIKLPAKDYSGSMRLDPGTTSGDYILHSIEIRGINTDFPG